ncbi:MAG: hypothetical protein M0Z50_19020 [Planctomycetia bacterium]|nr:hypothetical protein [Planctomycetia bacterium]
MNSLISVILSGGTGMWFWSLLRQSQPQPILQLPDGERLLQKALQRSGQFNGDKGAKQTWRVLADAAED